ncbi:hypothetical protein ACQR1W_09065 [Bradyrhizobium sp. HKCCYLS1011]|uniref:hypothetical protein n=1 Tax=Bradyrhizobium sp. HKCCYLS1011 TaxID=3420733 RepID=UPI003EB96A3A
MENRRSLQIRLAHQSDELKVLEQDKAPDLAAQFLEIKRLRRELRIAQCGRIALTAGHEPLSPNLGSSRRRSLAMKS